MDTSGGSEGGGPPLPASICASSRRPVARAAAAFTSADGSRAALTIDSAHQMGGKDGRGKPGLTARCLNARMQVLAISDCGSYCDYFGCGSLLQLIVSLTHQALQQALLLQPRRRVLRKGGCHLQGDKEDEKKP